MSTIRVLTGAGLLAMLAFPAGAFGQDDGEQDAAARAAEQCEPEGNSLTRGAEIELSYSMRSDDTQPKQTRYQNALEKANEALAEDSSLSAAYLYGARAHLGLRQYEEAAAMFDRLIELAPDCAQLARDYRYNAWVELYNRGIEQYQQGDMDAALASFATASAIYSDARSLANAASIYQTRGEAEKAIEAYRQVIEIGDDPELVRASTINLAELLRQEGRSDEAAQLYAEYASNNPDDVLGRLNYAITLMDGGNRDSAQAIFSDLMTRDDLTFEQWTQVGIGLYRAESYDQAAEAFSRAHSMQPLNKTVLENLANSLYLADRYEALLPLADTLVTRYPLETRNYSMLANAHREMGDTDAALAVLRGRDSLAVELASVELAPQPDSSYVLRGQVLGRTAAPGTSLAIPVEFVGEQGEVVVSDTLIVQAPAEGQSGSFEMALAPEQPIAGFHYGEATPVGGEAAGAAGAASGAGSSEPDDGGSGPAGAGEGSAGGGTGPPGGF